MTMIQTPRELISALVKTFPGYSFEETDGETPTLHRVMADFCTYFASNNNSFAEKQIKEFAQLVNAAVDAGGDLENAFGTCFLEHLGQIKARTPLSWFLSKAAKERLHV
jgi:hypothetical protein